MRYVDLLTGRVRGATKRGFARGEVYPEERYPEEGCGVRKDLDLYLMEAFSAVRAQLPPGEVLADEAWAEVAEVLARYWLGGCTREEAEGKLRAVHAGLDWGQVLDVPREWSGATSEDILIQLVPPGWPQVHKTVIVKMGK